ncbi:translation initiation factor 2 [Aspergillus mulundensis]|uniref:Translation initiation factor IF-2, mitochondrial n=1 Tax=Aspergillus mulundensis TaxID=1810919 RepID=A0A3D8T3Y7_9EURO|nr:hypothetical protein DSM5745_00588 [Aspergillus mulundensis]RDW93266.1 hypothetical protein DSM5745_00588 [Aspergillus mulundensis]
MQRRTIVQLSRRRPVDWPGTARLRDVTVSYHPRRCFHPALSRLNSSEHSSSGNPDGVTEFPTSQNSASKFGSRWARQQTTQPAALSLEEQAVRNALIAKAPSTSGSNPTAGSSDALQSAPRFGSRFAPKQTSQSASLSPEEQAVRDALIAKSRGPSSTNTTNGTTDSASFTSVPRFGSRWAARQASHSSTPSSEEQAVRNALMANSPGGSSTNTSNGANDGASSPTTPSFGTRWASRPTHQSSVLTPEEQALRDSLLRSANQRRSRNQEESTSQKSIPYRRPGFEFNTGDSRVPWRNRFPSSMDKESSELQPLREHEVHRLPRLSRAQRGQDWECPDCGFKCFGKYIACPMCKARRPGLIRPSSLQEEEPRGSIPKDWTCPGCGFNCFGKHRRCPRCKTRRQHANMGSRELSRASQTGGSIEPRGDMATGHDLYTDLSGETFEYSTGDFHEKPTKIRKTFARDAEADDKPRQSALRQHMAAKLAMEEETGEVDAGLRRRLKEMRSRKPERSEALEDKTDSWSSSPGRWKSRDDFDKKSKRRGDHRERESEIEEEEFDVEEYHRRREERKKLKKERRSKEVEEPQLSRLYLPEFISVSNFADVVGMRPAQLVEQMEQMGFEDVSYSHVLDAETAGLIAAEFGYEPILDTGADQDLTAAPEPEDKSMWPSRPPVVTIMGHVDHGKTTILDWLRKSSVVASEHGGITQHIGAFSVSMPSGKKITFLDTPGHAAFLDMRRRGADVTDIVVLVVAADDSVKPQTVEAIKHATSAKVPIIVAMSKIDKEGVNPERVKQDLSTHGIHVEDYGGDVQAIGVSGKTGQGMLELEEAIITLSEVLDHRADPDGFVEGWVIEGTTKSYGRVATVLIRRGTLRPGDILVAGNTWTRVRTLRNESGISISEATPGTPVEIDGWRENPTAGTELLQAEDEQHAKEVVEYRLEREESQKLGEDTTAINEARRELLDQRRREAAEDEEPAEEKPSGPKPVNFVVKADVHGSAEAVENSITAIGNNEVYARVLLSEVGPISESDIELAAAADGHIICFNMPIDPTMSRMAQNLGVNIMDHNIIYKLVDEVKDTLSEQLAPLITQRVTGEAEIGQVFEISLKGRAKTSIAGCKVRNGVISRGKKVRVIRGQETIYDGSITSLKNVKKDVTEMRKDTECGIGFENWTEFAVGDQIQSYEEISEKRQL